jgi:predicted dehydrogenase
MEAMWSRFLPFFSLVLDQLSAGTIGPVRAVHADLGFPLDRPEDRRWWAPGLGGGALLDLGVYPLSLIHALLGPPDEFGAAGVPAATGVDAQVVVASRHGDAVATAAASFTADMALDAVVAGREGRLRIHAPFHHSPLVTVHRRDRTVEAIDTSFEGSGYRGEAEEVQRCVRAGLVESELRPLDETLAVMWWMDGIRRQLR